MENLEHININGVEYYKFYCFDPAEIRNDTTNIEHHFWKHYKCGGDIYIGDNAHFLCRSCGETWPVPYSDYMSRFTAHVNGYYVSQSKIFKIDTTLKVLGSMLCKMGQDRFMKAVLEVEKQYTNTNFQQKETTKKP